MKMTKNKSVFLRRRNAQYLFKNTNFDYNNPRDWQSAMHQYAADYGEHFIPGSLVSDRGSVKSMGMIIGPIEKRKCKMMLRNGTSMMRTKYYARIRWMYDHGKALNYLSTETMDILYLSPFRAWRGFYQQKESALQAEPTPV